LPKRGRQQAGKGEMKQFLLIVLAILILANHAARADEQEAIEWQRVEQAAADEVNARCPALAAAVIEAKLHRPSLDDKSMSEEEWDAAFAKYDIIHNPEAMKEAIVIMQERFVKAKQWLFSKREVEASEELTSAAIKAGDEEAKLEIVDLQINGRVLLWNTIAVRCIVEASPHTDINGKVTNHENEYPKYTFAYVAADEASKKLNEITSDPDKFQTLYDNWIKYKITDENKVKPPNPTPTTVYREYDSKGNIIKEVNQ
jgi:hypothetical protein